MSFGAKEMARRVFVCSVAAYLTAGAVLYADEKAEKAEKTGKKARIVLIGHQADHPHGTHSYLPDLKLLKKCLEQAPGVEGIVCDGWPKDPQVLADAKAIVLECRMGGDLLFEKDHRQQAVDLMKKGVGLAAIHWATGASMGEDGDLYLRTLGGWFNTDFSRYLVETQRLRRADPAHPISRGWEDYDLREEYYIKLRFQPEAKPIMKATVAGEEHTIGWAYERPETSGRSFGFVGGHFHDNFAKLNFRRAIVNGILWTARLEVPAGGTPAEVAVEDLELPPPPAKKA